MNDPALDDLRNAYAIAKTASRRRRAWTEASSFMGLLGLCDNRPGQDITDTTMAAR